MNLLILSAGLGTRLRPITNKIPKPALPILNVPMIFWNTIYFEKSVFGSQIVNTFHLEDSLRERLSDFDHHFIFSSDGKEVLGTGGGITNNQDVLVTSSDFWVINGDGFFLTDHSFVKETEKKHADSGAICTLVVCDHPGVGVQFGGVWVDDNGKVLSIGKVKPKNAIKGYHFTGFRILSNKIFSYMPKRGPHELFDTLNKLIQQGEPVEYVHTPGDFFETGNEKDFLATNKKVIEFIKNKKYVSTIEAVLKRHSPNSKLNPQDFLIKFEATDAPKDLFCNDRVRIFEKTHFEGFLISGKNVTVREHCNLKNVVIVDNTDIPTHSNFSNCIIY